MATIADDPPQAQDEQTALALSYLRAKLNENDRALAELCRCLPGLAMDIGALIQSARRPAKPAPKSRKRRATKMREAHADAKRAGLPVKAIEVDGVRIEIAEADAPVAPVVERLPFDDWSNKRRLRNAL